MMSEKDIPGQGSVAVDMATTAVTTNQNADDSNMKQLWKFIYIDMSFVKSIVGILMAAEIFLSLLGLICVSIPKDEGCAYLYGSTYSYFEFVTSSCMITCLIWYALYAFAITKKVGFVRWDIGELIWCGFFALNYFIASCILASHVCRQGGYKAATAFGFLCLFAILAEGGITFKSFWDKRKGKRSSTGSGQQTAQTAEADSVQY